MAAGSFKVAPRKPPKGGTGTVKPQADTDRIAALEARIAELERLIGVRDEPTTEPEVLNSE